MSLFLLTFLNVSRLHQMYPFIGALRPGLLLTAIALGSVVLFPHHLAKGWARLWTTRFVAALTLVILASIPFGISPGASFYAFSQNGYKVFLGVFLLIVAVRDARDVWFFAWAYILGCLVLVYQALFVVELVSYGGEARLSDLFNWDANDLGLLLLVAMPLCMLLWRNASVRARIILGVVLVGSGAAIARSGSRGAFVGLACLILAYLVALKGVSVARKVAVVAGVLIALTLAAPPGYWDRIQGLSNLEEDYNAQATQGRKQLAIRGMGYMLDNPVFGIGFANFGRAEGTISELAREWRPGMPGIKWSAPHNTYVQVGAELGIPGLLLFVGLIGGCIFGTRRLRRRIPPHWTNGTWEQQFLSRSVLYLPLACIGFAAPATFLSFAYYETLYILAALTGGIYLSIPRVRRRDAGVRRPAVRRRRRPQPARSPMLPTLPDGGAP